MVAQQLENLTDVSSRPVDTQPWSLSDKQLKERLKEAANFVGDGDLMGGAVNAALEVKDFDPVRIGAIFDLAVTQAEHQATLAIINIRREMARRGLSEQ